jgi:hypothetical protein
MAAFAATAVFVGAGSASANVPLTPVSVDPFTNASSQHATEVEPDTFAFGSTVVATYQVGRFFNGGASDIGFARSTDGGATWGVSSFLPRADVQCRCVRRSEQPVRARQRPDRRL